MTDVDEPARGLEPNPDAEPVRSFAAPTRVDARARQRRRIQPLLLGGGIAAVLPAAFEADAPLVVMLAMLALGALSIAVWLVLRARTLPRRTRDTVGLVLAALSVGTLFLALFAIEGQQPETYLLITCALLCSLASIPSPGVRWSVQLASVVALGLALVVADRQALDVSVTVILLLVVAVLSNLLAGELMRARRSEVAARADAERRTELLEAVRDLRRTAAADAISATVRTLRSLAFDDARVVELRDGQLHEVDAAGEPAAVIPREGRLEWQVIDEDLTLVATVEGAGPGPPQAGFTGMTSVVAAPIRVAGHPAGVLLGARRRSGEPSPAEVEVAEVLAAHLGVVLDTEAQVERQRELLDRMAELDQMRSGFAREVSIELRDPLTIVRTVGEAMTRHGDEIDAGRRRVLLEQMCDHAEDLRHTIDTLLDFSRFQADRNDAHPVPVALTDLLQPVLRTAAAVSEPPSSELRDLGIVVEVDVVLVRHALEILLVTGLSEGAEEPVATVVIDHRRDDEVRLAVERVDGSAPSTLVRSLVSQLLVAGGASLGDDVDRPLVTLHRSSTPVEVAT